MEGHVRFGVRGGVRLGGWLFEELRIVQADWQLTDSARKAGRRLKCHRQQAAAVLGLVVSQECARSSPLRACGSASQQVA